MNFPKKKKKRLSPHRFSGFLFLSVLLVLSACGGGGGGGNSADSGGCDTPAYLTGSVGGGLTPAVNGTVPGDSLQALSSTVNVSPDAVEIIVQPQLGVSCADLTARYRGLTFKKEMRGGFCLFKSTLSGEDFLFLENDSDVKSVEINQQLQSLAIDPYASIDWAMTQTDAPYFLDLGTYPIEDVVIAVLDSGIRYHEDLPAPESSLWVQGYDFISDVDSAGDGDGPDSDPTDVGTEIFSHGGSITGIIAGIRDNGLGSFGVAAGVKIMPVRVSGTDGGTISDIVEGLRYAAGLPNDSDTIPPLKADIINISLGTDSFSTVLQTAIAAVRDNGVIVVASTGNDGVDKVSYPAAFDNVIGVGATDVSNVRAPYSNYGEGITLVAGGGNLDVGTTWDDGKFLLMGADQYGLGDGTSVAAPLVAGSLGWVKAACPDLTPLDIDKLIAGVHPDTSIMVTSDQGAAGYDFYYGYGLFSTDDGVAAAEEVCNVAYNPPQPSLSTTSLALSSEAKSGTIEITNIGGGELVISDLMYDTSLLTVETVENDSGYLLTATLSPDFFGQMDMPVDLYFSGISDPVRVTFEASVGAYANVTTAIVTLQLQDAETGAVQFSAYSDPSREQTYKFAAVTPGTYDLIAGVDLNSNAILCEEGEPCGEETAIVVECGDVIASVNVEML
ncbi:S8 family serine peptidase [uncultured Desulfuromusa sp.]|uniref:S8 family serine peptidase n=1 Tax=uncultured Desulfuromusa sp. TaxID=219183 RepID=UPI002AA8F8F2|nr:S8 family serine peptidase [uncultured Desulfuromusa sp.]